MFSCKGDQDRVPIATAYRQSLFSLVKDTKTVYWLLLLFLLCYSNTVWFKSVVFWHLLVPLFLLPQEVQEQRWWAVGVFCSVLVWNYYSILPVPFHCFSWSWWSCALHSAFLQKGAEKEDKIQWHLKRYRYVPECLIVCFRWNLSVGQLTSEEHYGVPPDYQKWLSNYPENCGCITCFTFAWISIKQNLQMHMMHAVLSACQFIVTSVSL